MQLTEPSTDSQYKTYMYALYAGTASQKASNSFTPPHSKIQAKSAHFLVFVKIPRFYKNHHKIR